MASDTISPFCIHPDTETMHTLSTFGYCFVVSNAADDKSIIDIFCKNTPLDQNDFQMHYIYFGQYLFTTPKQDMLGAHINTIVTNVKSSAWDLYTVLHVPPTPEATLQT